MECNNGATHCKIVTSFRVGPLANPHAVCIHELSERKDVGQRSDVDPLAIDEHAQPQSREAQSHLVPLTIGQLVRHALGVDMTRLHLHVVV